MLISFWEIVRMFRIFLLISLVYSWRIILCNTTESVKGMNSVLINGLSIVELSCSNNTMFHVIIKSSSNETIKNCQASIISHNFSQELPLNTGCRCQREIQCCNESLQAAFLLNISDIGFFQVDYECIVENRTYNTCDDYNLSMNLSDGVLDLCLAFHSLFADSSPPDICLYIITIGGNFTPLVLNHSVPTNWSNVCNESVFILQNQPAANECLPLTMNQSEICFSFNFTLRSYAHNSTANDFWIIFKVQGNMTVQCNQNATSQLTNSTDLTEATSTSSRDDNIYITAVAVGGVMILVLILLIVLVIRKRRRNKDKADGTTRKTPQPRDSQQAAQHQPNSSGYCEIDLSDGNDIVRITEQEHLHGTEPRDRRRHLAGNKFLSRLQPRNIMKLFKKSRGKRPAEDKLKGNQQEERNLYFILEPESETNLPQNVVVLTDRQGRRFEASEHIHLAKDDIHTGVLNVDISNASPYSEILTVDESLFHSSGKVSQIGQHNQKSTPNCRHYEEVDVDVDHEFGAQLTFEHEKSLGQNPIHNSVKPKLPPRRIVKILDVQNADDEIFMIDNVVYESADNVLNSIGQTKVLNSIGQTKVLNSIGQTKVLNSIGQTKVLNSIGQTKVRAQKETTHNEDNASEIKGDCCPYNSNHNITDQKLTVSVCSEPQSSKKIQANQSKSDANRHDQLQNVHSDEERETKPNPIHECDFSLKNPLFGAPNEQASRQVLNSITISDDDLESATDANDDINQDENGEEQYARLKAENVEVGDAKLKSKSECRVDAGLTEENDDGEDSEFKTENDKWEVTEIKIENDDGEATEFKIEDDDGEDTEFKTEDDGDDTELKTENNEEDTEFRTKKHEREDTEFKTEDDDDGEDTEVKTENDEEDTEFRTKKHEREDTEFKTEDDDDGEDTEVKTENDEEDTEFRTKKHEREDTEFKTEDDDGEDTEVKTENDEEDTEFRTKKHEREDTEFKTEDDDGEDTEVKTENDEEDTEFRTKKHEREDIEFKTENDHGKDTGFKNENGHGEDTEFKTENDYREDTEFKPENDDGEDTEFKTENDVGEDTEFKTEDDDGEDTEVKTENDEEDTEFRTKKHEREDIEFKTENDHGKDTGFKNENDHGEDTEFKTENDYREDTEFKTENDGGDDLEFVTENDYGEDTEFKTENDDVDDSGFKTENDEEEGTTFKTEVDGDDRESVT